MRKIAMIDPRDVPVANNVLEHCAQCHVGGSGEGSYVTGRIQSMARELLKYRAQEKEREDAEYAEYLRLKEKFKEV
jgi:hypothetical protein